MNWEKPIIEKVNNGVILHGNRIKTEEDKLEVLIFILKRIFENEHK